MRKISLHWKILIGMALGVLFGFILSNLNGGGIFISNWIKPFGTIFINSLKLIAIPLILASLIKGISDLKDISKLSSMGGVTILTYLSTTVIAVSVGLLLVNIIKPGDSISEKTRTELIEAYDSDAEEKRMAAAENKDSASTRDLKITVKFLTNEIRADALDVILFEKICKNNDCSTNKIKSKLEKEIKLAILKKASIFKEQGDRANAESVRKYRKGSKNKKAGKTPKDYN